MKKLNLLLILVERGAVGEEVRITIRELADDLQISPQSVLRLLEDAESEGLLKREIRGKKTYMELSPKGLQFLEEVCDKISSVLYNGVILGEVVSGIGEGAYYVRQYAALIREYLGFDPYPGTLNLRVLFPKTIFDALCNVRPVVLPGFTREGRTFGDVRAYPIKIRGLNGAIVVPSRTIHPPRIAEIIAPAYLRRELNLRDGDLVKVVVRE
ncbi:CTP-dependent riboflavin kinase [Thermococcus sp.]|uniref:CTP-dependent riboflavin kinase n=1 Tax=Thermococcus sp. TaxID=35749 RepID=UPI0025F0629D|nr:CTP-dependent riboflavin kinase [Thermococcus sp.]